MDYSETKSCRGIEETNRSSVNCCYVNGTYFEEDGSLSVVEDVEWDD